MATAVNIPAGAKPRRWPKRALIGFGILVLVITGGLAAWVPYAVENSNLQKALLHVESGNIPDESQEYSDVATAASMGLQAQPLMPGAYSHLSVHSGVTYNAVLTLKADGRYQYALTVGNARVHKLYQHAGRWWLQGGVLNTILLEGDAFLTAPAARDRKTPVRQLRLPSPPDQLILQAPYGSAVTFNKIDEERKAP